MKGNKLIIFTLFFCFCEPKSDDEWLVTSNEHVLDFVNNPILQPTEVFEWLIADPTVVLVGRQIHMFTNEVFHGILHFTADTNMPTNFTKQGTVIPFPGSSRPYALVEDDTIFIFYEQYQLPLFRTSHIMLRKGKIIIDDLGYATFHWEMTSTTILVPELEWEKIGTRRVGNPFVFYYQPLNEYRLYYSTSSLHLEDSNIDEPLYLGLARSTNLIGPWERVIMDPLPVDVSGLQNDDVLGIGSLKLVKSLFTNTNQTDFVALCNLITRNHLNKRTGSTISLLRSEDEGLSWHDSIGELIPPVNDNNGSWKHAYVYGYDTLQDPIDESYILVYYNGRNGWRDGMEAIGVSRVEVSVLNYNDF